ncbi:hypothetical protein DFP73DRAFT_582828 [Morchella snyderi]|nr:hypothetical protein DFP73DRAFT_582828 [Morchella snyderi]
MYWHWNLSRHATYASESSNRYIRSMLVGVDAVFLHNPRVSEMACSLACLVVSIDIIISWNVCGGYYIHSSYSLHTGIHVLVIIAQTRVFR